MKRIFTVLVFLIGFCGFAQTKAEKELFVLTFNAGPAWRVGATPDGLNSETKKYIKELNSGTSLDFGLYMRGKAENVAFGLKYNRFASSNSISNVIVNAPNGDSGVTTVSDEIIISFIGPSFMIYETNPTSKHEGFLEASLGYMQYKDEMNTLGRYILKGGTLGMTGSLGYKYRVLKNVSIGPQVNFIGGTLMQYTMKGDNGYNTTVKFKQNEGESLWRIDLSLGVIVRV